MRRIQAAVMALSFLAMTSLAGCSSVLTHVKPLSSAAASSSAAAPSSAASSSGAAASSSATAASTSGAPSAKAIAANAVATQAQASPAKVIDPTVLVIDASGTMNKTDVNPSRLVGAKRAARAVIRDLVDERPVGLLTYGTGTGNDDSDKAAGCQDIKVVVPIAPLGSDQRSQLNSGIDGLTASGFTPIGNALKQAAQTLTGGVGSIVLISDGEDTCAPPDPCAVAKELKASHPKLTISTVGFRTTGAASDQLSCVARATGGLFVTAADTHQLATRLQVASSGAAAHDVLTPTGRGSIELGQKADAIAKANKGFPSLNSAKPYQGSVPGKDLVVVIWKDCDYIFQAGVLIAIQPQRNVSTADRIQPGSSAGEVSTTYGPPIALGNNSDGTQTAVYTADSQAGTAYHVTFTKAGGSVKYIVLCRCLRDSVSSGSVVIAENKIGDLSLPLTASVENEQKLIDVMGREPDEYDSLGYCEFAGPGGIGRSMRWGDFTIMGYGFAPDEVHYTSWVMRGPDLPRNFTLPDGPTMLNRSVSDLRAEYPQVRVTEGLEPGEIILELDDPSRGDNSLMWNVDGNYATILTGGESQMCD